MIDYKKIIPSKELRLRLLKTLNFIPDSLMLRIQYRIKMGRKLNLKSPRRYSEKLQWYKLNYKDPQMKICVDKYSVRNFVKSRGCEKYLNDLYGVYDSPDQIDYDSLPNSFVLKDTLGSGGNSVVIVENKDKINKKELNERLKGWVSVSKGDKNPGREWVYDGQNHRIVAEKNLIVSGRTDLPDYKFFCFNGKPVCLYYMQNYALHHDQGELGFFTAKDFHLMNVRRADFKTLNTQPSKPQNYDEMYEAAKKLSEGFPHVRVDFYNIEGKIIFGEMTFFNASGYVQFEPDSFDYKLGKYFKLPR